MKIRIFLHSFENHYSFNKHWKKWKLINCSVEIDAKVNSSLTHYKERVDQSNGVALPLKGSFIDRLPHVFALCFMPFVFEPTIKARLVL